MKRNRVLAALLAAPLLLAGFPAAAQAAPDPDLKIDSITLNKTSVAVSGLNTAPVTVTVKGTYSGDSPVNVILERTGGTGSQRTLFSTNLPRLANGTWSGPLQVPSTANGTFKVTGVLTGPFFPGSGSMTDPTPYAGPSLAVTGTHQPKITASVTPKVVPFGRRTRSSGRSATRRPASRTAARSASRSGPTAAASSTSGRSTRTHQHQRRGDQGVPGL